jgi:Acetyltransferase (GNAT) domain
VSAPATAALLADAGAAAESEEHFFRSRPFLDAEGATHTLRIEAGEAELVAPLIVRRVGEGPERDAISPYGYPGIVRRERERSLSRIAGQTAFSPGPDFSLDPDAVDFSGTGLVSVFIRHTLEEPPLRGAVERNVVQVADPALPLKLRPSDRNRINRNRRNGYEVVVVPGPETEPAQRAGFVEAYEQTMRRAGAAERYFFGPAYFDRILGSAATWLALALDSGGTAAAASIAVRSDGYVHYYLSGSLDSHLRDSPMKNVVATLVELSSELDLPLNLGGGLSRGDRLEEFKRGFANSERPWRASELVCDGDAYDRLAGDRDAGGFFPAYRAPGG